MFFVFFFKKSSSENLYRLSVFTLYFRSSFVLTLWKITEDFYKYILIFYGEFESSFPIYIFIFAETQISYRIPLYSFIRFYISYHFLNIPSQLYLKP